MANPKVTNGTMNVTNDAINVSRDATNDRRKGTEDGPLRLKRNMGMVPAVINDAINITNDAINVTDDATKDMAKDESDDGRGGSPQLKRNIGLIPAFSYVAGSMIGVGIFVSPQTVLINSGGSVGISLCVWFFSALIALFGALIYAEYGTRIRKSGGSYTYVREAWGDGAGFVFLWTQLVVVGPMATALGAMTAAEYALRPVFLQCPHMVPRDGKVLLALCILGLLVYVNSYDTSWGAAVQTLSTLCKVSALVVIIIVGIVFICKQGGSDNFEDLFESDQLTAGGLSLAVYSCSYAYMGWDNLNMATEEVKNANRNIPLAIALAVGLTATVYLSAMIAYHAVLTTPQITSGLAVAAVFMEMTFPPLMWVIVPCVAISATGIVNTIIFTSTRINFIGGRDGLFPQVLSMVSVSRRTPLVSCLVLGLAAALVVPMGNVQSVLGAYAFFRAGGETIAILGIFRLRRKFPASEKTYVVPSVVPVVYLLINLSLAIVAITRDTSRYVIPLLMALSGIPLYFLSTSPVFTRGPLKRLNDTLVGICRKLLLCEYATKTY